MWKKQLAGAVLLCGLLLANVLSVNAGGINAAEQRIIDYYNGTVTYEGKVYRFTEDGKQKAYNKLIEDDVDLTEREVDSAIRQANANLKQGIDEGYLVEVTGDEPNTEIPDTSDPVIPPDTETPDPGTIDTEAPDSGKGDINMPITGGGEGNGTPGAGTGTIPGKRPVYPDAQKKDVQNFLKEALKEGEYAKVNTSVSQEEDGTEKDWVATVAQYLKGTVDVVAKDGSVIFSTGLAVKNTGYFTGGLAIAAVLFIGILGGGLAVISWRKKKGYFSMPVLTAVAGIFTFAVFAGGFLKSETGKWNSVWILGSPEYTYAAEQDGQRQTENEGAEILPLQGEQYGEIICEGVDLRVPLYYGDTEEILEQGAGTYTGSKLPGQGGEILIGGHDTTFFAPLESIQEGMALSVKTGYGQYEYEVTGTEVADVMDYAQRQTQEEELVLYTCYPFGAEDDLRSERFFVYAKKMSEPEVGE